MFLLNAFSVLTHNHEFQPSQEGVSKKSKVNEPARAKRAERAERSGASERDELCKQTKVVSDRVAR